MHLLQTAITAASCLLLISAAVLTSEPQAVSSTSSQTSSASLRPSDSSAAFFAQTTFPSSSPAAGTSIAVFTIGRAPYTATVVSSIVQIAGYQLSIGGSGALVGSVQVSAASSGFIEDGQLVPYSMFVPSSTTSVQAPTMSSTSTSSVAAATTTSSSSSRGAAAAIAMPLQAIVAFGGAAMAGLII